MMVFFLKPVYFVIDMIGDLGEKFTDSLQGLRGFIDFFRKARKSVSLASLRQQELLALRKS